MPSLRRKPAEFRSRVLAVYRDRYKDFGPTLASEKMQEHEKIAVHRETLRRWLIAEGEWRCGAKERVHRPTLPRPGRSRHRRPRARWADRAPLSRRAAPR
jgi:hypothetical protein